MSKSVYSLVLTDQIVEQLDRQAYRRGVSRSALIDRILAEHLSYQTPEMQLQQVWGSALEALRELDALQLMLQPAGGTMALRSALRYKYNPTVKYALELYKDPGEQIGCLKVSLRSQSQDLLYWFDRFCALWQSLESVPGTVREPGRYQRPLWLRRQLDGETLGREIVRYVACFDSALKEYFDLLDQPDRAAAAAARRLAAYNGALKE